MPAELQQVSYQYLNMSDGVESRNGRWASGTSLDGRGEIEYVERPSPLSDDEGLLADADPRLLTVVNGHISGLTC